MHIIYWNWGGWEIVRSGTPNIYIVENLPCNASVWVVPGTLETN